MTSFGQIMLQNSIFMDFGPNDGTNSNFSGTNGSKLWKNITNGRVSVTSVNLKILEQQTQVFLFYVIAASQTNGKLYGGFIEYINNLG